MGIIMLLRSVAALQMKSKIDPCAKEEIRNDASTSRKRETEKVNGFKSCIPDVQTVYDDPVAD